MNCQDIQNNIDDYLDDGLDRETWSRFQAHLDKCSDCAVYLNQTQTLKNTLRSMPAPIPDKDLADRLFSRVSVSEKRTLPAFSNWMKIAAGLILFFSLGFFSRDIWHPRLNSMPEVMVSANSEEKVRLVFHSAEALNNVTFSIKLPEGFDLAGYPNQRELNWQGALDKGDNFLVLPVIARRVQSGSVIATIRYGDQTKQFGVRLTVKSPIEQGLKEELPGKMFDIAA